MKKAISFLLILSLFLGGTFLLPAFVNAGGGGGEEKPAPEPAPAPAPEPEPSFWDRVVDTAKEVVSLGTADTVTYNSNQGVTQSDSWSSTGDAAGTAWLGGSAVNTITNVAGAVQVVTDTVQEIGAAITGNEVATLTYNGSGETNATSEWLMDRAWDVGYWADGTFTEDHINVISTTSSLEIVGNEVVVTTTESLNAYFVPGQGGTFLSAVLRQDVVDTRITVTTIPIEEYTPPPPAEEPPPPPPSKIIDWWPSFAPTLGEEGAEEGQIEEQPSTPPGTPPGGGTPPGAPGAPGGPEGGGASPNNPPQALISCDPSECGSTDCFAYTGCPFHLINNSFDPNGQADIVKSEWDIKNWGSDSDLSCSNLCNFTPQTTILTPGTYTIGLFVQDLAGASDGETVTFYLKKEVTAGFMCSLNNENWQVCEELSPSIGELVYLKDDPSLPEYSIPSEGATAIISRIWKLNGEVFSSDNNASLSLNLTKISNTLQLAITDNQGRTDAISHIISGGFPVPEYKEVPPFIWLKKVFAGIAEFFK